ncbi:hypothetical protein D3C80_1480640 [compost metagenome]
MQEFRLRQPLGVPRAVAERLRRTDRDQPFAEQQGAFPFIRKVSATEQHRAVERFVGEIDLVHIHPGAGQLHFVVAALHAEGAEPRQQPAHGQGRGRLQAHYALIRTQTGAGALKGVEAVAQTGQQQARRLGQFQLAAAALEQAAVEMLLQGADMPAHRALGDRQFLGGAGEGGMPGGGFEGAQGIKRRKLAGHGILLDE